ncbi:MAG TPA: ATP-binding protein [Armatimonadota bacterium]
MPQHPIANDSSSPRGHTAALLEHMSDAYLLLDDQGIIHTANPQAAQLFQRPVAELVGARIGDILPAEIAEACTVFCQADATAHQRFSFHCTPERQPACWEVRRQVEAQHLRAIFIRDVTAMQQLHDELQGVRQSLRMLLSAGFAAMLLVEDAEIREVNAACATLFEQTPDELVGRPFADLVIPEDRDILLCHLTSGHPGAATCHAYRRDGSLFLAEVCLTDFTLHGQRIQLVTVHDKTVNEATDLLVDHRFNELEYLSQTALRFLEKMTTDDMYHFIGEQILQLAGTAIIMVHTYDPRVGEMVVQSVHAAPHDMAAMEVALGRSLVGSALPVSPPLIERIMAGDCADTPDALHPFSGGARSPQCCHDIEQQLNIRALHFFPLSTHEELLGALVIAMVGQITPQHPRLITAFVNQAGIAVQRHRVEADLDRERAYLSTAIDMLPIPLTFITPDAHYERRNRAMQALLDRFHIQHELGWNYLDPNTRVPIKQLQNPLHRAFQGEVTNGKELILATNSAEELPVMVYCAPVCLEQTVLAAVCAIEDISALKEADRVKDEFLTVLSHELKTPLTCILGWSEVAQLHKEPAIVDQAFKVVYRNARRQQVLINELLDISRIIYRKLYIALVPLDLRNQVLLAVENIQQEAIRRQIAVNITAPLPSLPISADATRIQQCLGNLLHNSLKFTPAGGTIAITCTAEGPFAVLSISDTGCGIPAELLGQLFRPFTQGMRNETEGGLGLGLALVKGIIALHNGEISVSSAGSGLGSTFTIRLPLSTAEPSRALPV